MTENFVEKNEPFFVEFGKILLKHQRDSARLCDIAGESTDQAAQHFARYLRAARANSGMTPSDLAEKTDISEAVIYALERGLIFSKTIQAQHLHRLADVLGEDIDIFALILECDIPQLGMAGVPTIAQNDWQAAVAYFGSTPKVLLVLGMMLATFFMSALFIQHREIKALPAFIAPDMTGGTAPASTTSHIATVLLGEPLIGIVQAANRPAIALPLISLLLLLLLWIAIKKQYLPSRLTIITPNAQRKLIYATPMLLTLICLLSAMYIPSFFHSASAMPTSEMTSVKIASGWNEASLVDQNFDHVRAVMVANLDRDGYIDILGCEGDRGIVWWENTQPNNSLDKIIWQGGNATTTSQATSKVLELAGGDDLVSFSEWLWTEPRTMRVGYENSEIGLNVLTMGTEQSLSSSRSGLDGLYFIEFEYHFDSHRWLPVNRSDWISYPTAHQDYPWTLTSTYGTRYIEAWAMDKAGNISAEPNIEDINLLPLEQGVESAEDYANIPFALLFGILFTLISSVVIYDGKIILSLGGSRDPPD